MTPEDEPTPHLDLGGIWRATPSDEALQRSFPDPASDDATWEEVPVPGHWRNHPAFGTCDGPMLYRRRFDTPAWWAVEPGRRAWVTFAGLFYQGDVWLDGSYLGDTEGYFWPQTFEVTPQLSRRTEHLLAVELACPPDGDRGARRNLTGAFQGGEGIATDWNPGGIWAPVRVWSTGGLRIASLRATCLDASAERATLELEAVLDAAAPTQARLSTEVVPAAGAGAAVAHHLDQPVAAGDNRVAWRVQVERPQLWWPRALGTQPMYRMEVTVADAGGLSDRRRLATGLRQLRMRDFVVSVNGERIFLKGSTLAPTDRALADPEPETIRSDVALAVSAGLDLLRVHAHVGRPELYDAADRAGLLLWQDLPLQWAYHGVRQQAVRQAGQAADLLGHHPSVAIWCGHDAPYPSGPARGTGSAGIAAAARAGRRLLPSWNRTSLDRSIRRALEKADSSRPVVAHSGVPPHPAGGTDSHIHLGWRHGNLADLPSTLARLPVLARWVGEFGAPAVPGSDAFMDPERWPDLDWAGLARSHGLDKEAFDRWLPPAGYDSLPAWRAATQSRQADLVRFYVETLRRLKYRPAGGFCHSFLTDAQPAVSAAVVDHRRVAKLALQALAAACSPVIVVADRPADRYREGERLALDVHVVNDRRVALAGRVMAVLSGPALHKRWVFAGHVGADSCTRIGRIEHTWGAGAGPVQVDLRLELDDPPDLAALTNSYGSVVS
ncbi:MAG: glycoside hydrolase family 2 protein [Acidimicrobiales bacterium]